MGVVPHKVAAHLVSEAARILVHFGLRLPCTVQFTDCGALCMSAGRITVSLAHSCTESYVLSKLCTDMQVQLTRHLQTVPNFIINYDLPSVGG